MTSTRSPKPLDLKFRRSRLLCGYFVAVHSLAVLSLYIFVPLLLAALMTVPLILSVGFYIFRDVFYLHHSSLAHIAFAENRWRVFLGEIGQSSAPEVQPLECLSSVVLPFGVVLRFRLLGGRKRSVLVFPDHLNANEYRKLRQIANFASAT